MKEVKRLGATLNLCDTLGNDLLEVIGEKKKTKTIFPGIKNHIRLLIWTGRRSKNGNWRGEKTTGPAIAMDPAFLYIWAHPMKCRSSEWNSDPC